MGLAVRLTGFIAAVALSPSVLACKRPRADVAYYYRTNAAAISAHVVSTKRAWVRWQAMSDDRLAGTEIALIVDKSWKGRLHPGETVATTTIDEAGLRGTAVAVGDVVLAYFDGHLPFEYSRCAVRTGDAYEQEMAQLSRLAADRTRRNQT